MRKLVVLSAAALAGLAGLAGVGLAAFLAVYPRVGPAPNLRVQPTPERLARGEYLATRLAGCLDCHSTRDWRYFSGPVVPGTEGKGGQPFGVELGLPGTFYAGNITPAVLGGWTDGEIIRSIASGVTRDGRALFPIMPYPAYCGLADDDQAAIVAYLRTLKPIANAVPPSRPRFPVNLIVRTLPQPCGPRALPDAHEAGAYLAAACVECHTLLQGGQPVKGMEYAGGREFPLPAGGLVRSSNITPDLETGIGRWTEDSFAARFRVFAGENGRRIRVVPGEFNTVMPWTQMALLTDTDLGLIYRYLRALKPIRNPVERFSRTIDRHPN